MTEPTARRKIADEVFDRLAPLVRTGEIAPEDPLPSERALMDRFGVSHPAVREALQRLHYIGLTRISHGERSRLIAPSPRLALRQAGGIAAERMARHLDREAGRT